MDTVIKRQILNNDCYITYVDVSKSILRAKKIHNLKKLSQNLMARLFINLAYMSSNLKNESDKLTINVRTEGVAENVLGVGDYNLNLRGFIDNSNIDYSTNDKESELKDVVKGGRITVIKSMGLKEPYTGSAQITNKNIIEDFCSYYKYSEQNETKVVVLNKSCTRAIFINLYPFASKSLLLEAERVIRENKKLFKSDNIKEALESLFGESEIISRKVKYKCNCSRSYIKKILITMGKSELESIIEENGKVEVNCQFCEKNYTFNKEDVQKLFKN